MKKSILVLLVLLTSLLIVTPVLAQGAIDNGYVYCTAPFFQADGRLNAWHQCAPIAAYEDGSGGMYIHWAVGEDYHVGGLALWVTAEDIAAVDVTGLGPTEQVLVTSGNGIMVYLTGDGILKVEIPGEYGFYFDSSLLTAEPPPENFPCEVMPDACGNKAMPIPV